MDEGYIPVSVFLSYARKNEAVVVRLQKDLLAQGIPAQRDRDIARPGEDWEERIRAYIRSSSCVIYVASPDARASSVVRGELTLADTYAKKIYFAWAVGERWADVVPLEYVPKHYIDIRDNRYQSGLRELIDQLKHCSRQSMNVLLMPPREGEEPVKPDSGAKAKPGLRTIMYFLLRFFMRRSQKQTASTGLTRVAEGSHAGSRNPYKGLRAFTMEEKDDFFGRDDLIQRMLDEIKGILQVEHQKSQEPRFLTLVGPSGSGKSSVVMAGLLPRLQQGNDIAGSERWKLLRPMRPGKDPVEALAQILLPHLPNTIHMGTILDNLRDDSTRALHHYASEIARQPGERVVLVVDQFEELFTEATDTQRQQFIDLLAIASTEPLNKVMVIVTLRADFSNHPMNYPLLHRLIEAHRIPIPPMTVENLRAVIERPAQLPDVRVKFEENLIGDLLLDIHGQEENLPLLQFTLNKLFDVHDRNTGCLTFRDYEAIGKIKGAISQHADETYDQLPTPEHRKLAEVLFTRLINPGGLEQEATRRRVFKEEFAYKDPVKQQYIQETINAFIQARLITADEITRENVQTHHIEKAPIIEISHEALISAWRRLADWVKLSHDDMLIREALDHDIERWEVGKRPRKQLYSGEHLSRIKDLAKRTTLNRKEEDFLQQSRQRQLRNRMVLVCSIFLVVCMVGGGVYAALPYLLSHTSSTTVTNLQSSGPGSLAQVIHDAAPDSTITFAPYLQGTILLKRQDLDIYKDLVVLGPDTQAITISNGKNRQGMGNDGPKVHVHIGAIVTFKNLSFSGSSVFQNGFIDNEGALTLDNCVISNNRSYYDGGGIANWRGTLNLIASTVDHNTAQSNGGGVYSWQGSLKIDNSTISNNEAGNDGGGIYALNNGVTVSGSKITGNQTTSSDDTSNGGGMTVLNGVLVLDTSDITNNKTEGYGAGLTLLGSNGFLRESVVSRNMANHKGGGLAVEQDTENGASSLLVIADMEITATPLGSYWVGGNIAPDHTSVDILGKYNKNVGFSSMNPLLVNNDTSEVNGNPAPVHPPEKSPQYLGTVNLDAYCHALFASSISPSEKPSLEFVTSEHMNCALFSGQKVLKRSPIDTRVACQWQYKQANVIARLANYYDPSSWQCYKNEVRLGGITNYLDSYCKFMLHTAGANNNRDGTAYDWHCRDVKGNPVKNLSITDICQQYYHRPDALDVLTDFTKPDGWECIAPIK